VIFKICGVLRKGMPQLVVLAGIGAWVASTQVPARGAEMTGEFRRGIAIPHAMAWAPIEPAPSRAFIFPAFTYQAKALALELRALRRTGFDFVRLAIDPGPFLQFQGAQRDYVDRVLMDRVGLILSSGLSVLIDFHPSDMHEDYRAEALTRGVATPRFQEYLGLLTRTAQLLVALQSPRVMLEVMNEPPVAPDVWRPMLQAAYNAIRTHAPRIQLLLDGGESPIPQNIEALTSFKNDPEVFFNFHYYEPYQFTHQGASWMAARYLANVPYPARARSLQDSLDATAAAIAATDLPLPQKILATRDAQGRLVSYRNSSFDRTTIAHTFGQIASWMHRHGVPQNRVFLGEFGAIKSDRLDQHTGERARWFRDVREEAEARGFVWTVWAYRGAGGFSLIQNDTDTDIEPAIVDALGLSQ
jgi:hypothetical protein